MRREATAAAVLALPQAGLVLVTSLLLLVVVVPVWGPAAPGVAPPPAAAGSRWSGDLLAVVVLQGASAVLLGAAGAVFLARGSRAAWRGLVAAQTGQLLLCACWLVWLLLEVGPGRTAGPAGTATVVALAVGFAVLPAAALALAAGGAVRRRDAGGTAGP